MYTKDQIVLRTCHILVKNFINQIEEKRESVHTRIFNYILHPEGKYVHYGVSTNVTEQTQNHPEHVVPCAILIDETFRLLKEGRLNETEIAHLLQKHWKIVTITKEEARKIDYELGYKSRMPDGWSFEKTDPFKRLNEAGIEIIPDI